jgi:hypothetical protein
VEQSGCVDEHESDDGRDAVWNAGDEPGGDAAVWIYAQYAQYAKHA